MNPFDMTYTFSLYSADGIRASSEPFRTSKPASSADSKSVSDANVEPESDTSDDKE